MNVIPYNKRTYDQMNTRCCEKNKPKQTQFLRSPAPLPPRLSLDSTASPAKITPVRGQIGCPPPAHRRTKGKAMAKLESTPTGITRQPPYYHEA